MRKVAWTKAIPRTTDKRMDKTAMAARKLLVVLPIVVPLPLSLDSPSPSEAAVLPRGEIEANGDTEGILLVGTAVVCKEGSRDEVGELDGTRLGSSESVRGAVTVGEKVPVENCDERGYSDGSDGEVLGVYSG